MPAGGGLVPTNGGTKTEIKRVEVDGWDHGMVDDPLGYVVLREVRPGWRAHPFTHRLNEPVARVRRWAV
jgi:hypothetical protein